MVKPIFACLFFLCAIFYSAESICFTPLKPDQAFIFNTELKTNKNTFAVIVHLDIAPHYHIYKKSLKFNVLNKNSNFKLGNIIYPKPIVVNDQAIGKVEEYSDNLSMTIPILSTKQILKNNNQRIQEIIAKPNELILESRYSGCSDYRFCYPEIQQITSFKINANLMGNLLKNGQKEASTSRNKMAEKAQSALNIHNAPFKNISSNKYWNYFIKIIEFFWMGILLSCTPCILPTIPILFSILNKEILDKNRKAIRKVILPSVVYIFSMALTYSILGLIASILGRHIQSSMQNTFVLSLTSAIFILLALSLFDVYHMKFNKLTNLIHKTIDKHTKQSKNHYLACASMGLLSALVVSPCTSAPLIVALTYIAKESNPLFGSIVLFATGLGMGIPLLALAFFGYKYFPKSGNWMHFIKFSFGIIILWIAFEILERIFSENIQMLLWAVYCSIVAILTIKIQFIQTKSRNIMLKLSIQMLLALYACLLIYGYMIGNTNPIKPFSKITNSFVINKTTTSYSELNKFLNQALVNKQQIFIIFYAKWCSNCRYVENQILNTQSIVNAYKNWTKIEIDITNQTIDTQKIMGEFNVIAPPVILLFNEKKLSTVKNINFFKPDKALIGEQITTFNLLH